jgi:hypothetical protein
VRKLILISVLLLASASAQAAERILSLAGTDTPAAASNTTRQTLPPTAQTGSAKPHANEPAVQTRGLKPRSQARSDDSDEAKARRIAAKYGISW